MNLPLISKRRGKSKQVFEYRFLPIEETNLWPRKLGGESWVMINRAPVLTLWAAVVAEVLGFEHDEALTLGRNRGTNHQGGMDNLYAFFSSSLPRISSGIFPCSRQMERRMVSMAQERAM